MIDTQQIADLEARVLRIIDLAERLRVENLALNEELQASIVRNGELETQFEQLREGQQEVDKIISRTLKKLDGLENAWAESQVQEISKSKAKANRKTPTPILSESNSDMQGSSENFSGDL